jgi:GH15 family glucan-1,4-alpha-glucosidase
MSIDRVTKSLVELSVELILENQAPSGAYVAAPGYDTYAFSWLRDGAFIALAMDAYGERRSSWAFHRWVADTVERYAHKVELLVAEEAVALGPIADPLVPLEDRYVLHTRFNVDGEESGHGWGNFQLDGYGFWLTSLVKHLGSDVDPAPFERAVNLVSEYLALTWNHPCYDCWEEYPSRHHTATWAAVAGGLQKAGRLFGRDDWMMLSERITQAIELSVGPSGILKKFVLEEETDEPTPLPIDQAVAGHERIGRPLGPNALDASVLLVLGEHGPWNPDLPIVSATLSAIEESLVVGGGVHRYLEDEYYGGGLWSVLAGALAIVQSSVGEDPTAAVDWIEKQADQAGNLGEQSSETLRHPDKMGPWMERWGRPATPLLWSHAMYLLAKKL